MAKPGHSPAATHTLWGGGQPRTLQLLVLAPVPAEPSHLILFLAFFPVGAPVTCGGCGPGLAREGPRIADALGWGGAQRH